MKDDCIEKYHYKNIPKGIHEDGGFNGIGK